MLKFEKHIQTRNPALRSIGNISGSISVYFLMKEIRSEDKKNNLRAKVFAKLFSIFERPQKRWGTYYTPAQALAVKGDQQWTVPRSHKNTLL
jgi:hypothetical protein